VLLHAFAGSGKTATAAEFARWYAQTGGTAAVLFSSFEAHRTLPQLLEQLGRLFEEEIADAGKQWAAITSLDERRDIALRIFAQTPVLWIWDNVEPVTGFPAGSVSAWSSEEQQELAGFLRDAAQSGARFLLTSRRDERSWLGDFPVRLTMPPMPFRERMQLADALAKKLGRSIHDVEDWKSLLDFTQGNPLTITVVGGEALRSNLRTSSDIKSLLPNSRQAWPISTTR